MQYTVFNDENTRASKIDSVPFSPPKALLPDTEIHNGGKSPKPANFSKQRTIPIKSVQVCNNCNNENDHILYS